MGRATSYTTVSIWFNVEQDMVFWEVFLKVIRDLLILRNLLSLLFIWFLDGAGSCQDDTVGCYLVFFFTD